MKWYYLENIPNYVDTVPSGFQENGVPLRIPKPDLTSQELVKELNRYQPDVILTNGWTPFHREPYFQVLRQYCEETQSLHVFWSTEDPLHTDYWGMYILEIGQPDIVFTHAVHAPKMYQERGGPSYYLPFACNPRIHRSLPSLPQYRSDIALVANFSNATMESWRIRSLRILLEPLLRANFSVSIWGKGWEQGKKLLPFSVPDSTIRGPLPYNRVPYVYSSAKLVLGIQNHRDLLTRRTWECLGTGGLLITNHTPAVLRHFRPRQHLLTSRSAEETRKLAHFLLQNKETRQTIAANGQKSVHQNHRYAHRVQEMLDIASKMLQIKRKKRKSYRFPSPLLRQEIRTHSTFSSILPQGKLSKSSYLTVKRKKGSPNQEIRSGLLFSLASCAKEGLDLHQAQLKLFLAIDPIKNTKITCRFFSCTEELSHPTLEKEAQTISVDMNILNRKKVYQVPITLNLTSLIQRFIQQKKKTLGIYLYLPTHDHGAVQFLGPQKPKIHALSGIVFYRRFVPRLEITYQNKPSHLLPLDWSPFVGGSG